MNVKLADKIIAVICICMCFPIISAELSLKEFSFDIKESYLPVPGDKKVRVLDLIPKEVVAPKKMMCIQGGPGGSCFSLLQLICINKAFPQHYHYRIYDPIATGKSDDMPPEEITVEGELQRLKVVCDDFTTCGGESSFALHGASWGATLAALHASRNPENITHLIVVSPLFSTKKWVRDAHLLLPKFHIETGKKYSHITSLDDLSECEKAADQYEYLFLRRYLPPYCSLLERECFFLLKKMFFKSCRTFNDEVYRYMWGPNEWNPNPDGPLGNFDCLQQLKKIPHPTQVLIGDSDQVSSLTGHEYAQKIGKDHGKRNYLFIVPKASHSLISEKPEYHRSRIEALLERDPYK